MGYSHGKLWTESEVKRAVFEVVEKLQLDRMPSRKEMDDYFGNAALSNRLAKTGGLYHYAEIYGLEVKKSESLFGIELERHLRDELIKRGYVAELTSIKFPYDILVNGRVKIDVKAGRILKTKGSSYYTFNLEKTAQTCDLYVAVTMRPDDEINKMYIIPSSVMTGKTQLSLGANKSRYDKYVDRWDIIEKLDKAFKAVEAS
jgi:hypothetical protein